LAIKKIKISLDKSLSVRS